MKRFTLLFLWVLIALPLLAMGVGGDEPSETPTPTLTIELSDDLRLSKALEDLGFLRDDPMMGGLYYAPIHELIIKGKILAVDFAEMNKVQELQTLNLSESTVEDNRVPAQSFGFDDPNLFPFGNGTITNVILPSSITSIGNEAFIACRSLSSVNFEDLTSLRSIGNSSFKECSSLRSVYLPVTATSIGNNAFANCSSLESVDVADGNVAYISEEGVLYQRSPKSLILFPKGKIVESFAISEGTISIADRVFMDRYDLKSISMPNSVKTIGVSAFASCSNLESIILSTSLESIGDQAFFSSGLVNIDLPNGLKEIGGAAFSGSYNLKNVVFPSSLQIIGTSSFSGCSSLETADFSLVNSLTEVPYALFSNCSNLKSVNLSHITDIKYIGESAFANCSSLETIEISGSVKEIHFGAFQNCNILKSFEFKNVETILNVAFANCSSLESLVIPATMKYIGESVFAGCTSIASIEVDGDNWDFEVGEDGILYNVSVGRNIIFVPINNPIEHIVFDSEVQVIPNYAFAGNQNLKSITFTASFLTKIGESAFMGCSNLTSVNFQAGVPNLESIGSSAFEDCVSLESINFSGANKLVEMGGLAFKNCEMLEILDFSSSSVQAYGYQTFAGCSNLSELKLNNNYENMSSEIISGCFRLSDILLSGGLTSSWSVSGSAFTNSGVSNIVIGEGSTIFQGGGAMVLIDNGAKIFMVAPGVTGNLLIPDGVIGSEWSAFDSRPVIDTLTLPASYTGEIDPFAVLNSLKAYDVAQDNPQYSAKDGLLLNSEGDKLVAFPSNLAVEYIVPSGIKSLGANAISQNSLLERLTFGSVVEYLDNNSISNCSALKSITLSENFKGFADMAVMNCNNLTDITILGSQVAEVFSFSFGWFLAEGFTVYVPEDMLDLYKAESSWDQYNVQVIGSTSTPEVSDDMFNVYSENGVVVVETLVDGAKLSIFDINGKMIETVNLLSNRTEIHLSGKTNTVVIASLSINGERVFVRKLVL